MATWASYGRLIVYQTEDRVTSRRIDNPFQEAVRGSLECDPGEIRFHGTYLDVHCPNVQNVSLVPSPPLSWGRFFPKLGGSILWMLLSFSLLAYRWDGMRAFLVRLIAYAVAFMALYAAAFSFMRFRRPQWIRVEYRDSSGEMRRAYFAHYYASFGTSADTTRIFPKIQEATLGSAVPTA